MFVEEEVDPELVAEHPLIEITVKESAKLVNPLILRFSSCR